LKISRTLTQSELRITNYVQPFGHENSAAGRKEYSKTDIAKLRNIKFSVINPNISVDKLLGIQLAFSGRSSKQSQF
jgi:hypothetical protein